MAIYFVAGVASQKLIPGVDEIFLFFGWSLFSKVRSRVRYEIEWRHVARDLPLLSTLLRQTGRSPTD